MEVRDAVAQPHFHVREARVRAGPPSRQEPLACDQGCLGRAEVGRAERGGDESRNLRNCIKSRAGDENRGNKFTESPQ